MAYKQNDEASVSLSEHPEFLALLQNDQFRHNLETRPAETLEKFGIELDAASLPSVVQLPRQSLTLQTGLRAGAGGKVLLEFAGLH